MLFKILELNFYALLSKILENFKQCTSVLIIMVSYPNVLWRPKTENSNMKEKIGRKLNFNHIQSFNHS